MSDRPKTNTWGNSPNRKAPVTISPWDENSSTVRRLHKPYVIHDGAVDAPRTARPASYDLSSSTSAPPEGDLPPRPASATGRYPKSLVSPSEPTRPGVIKNSSSIPDQYAQGRARPTSLAFQPNITPATPSPTTPKTPIRDSARSSVIEQSRRGYRPTSTDSPHESEARRKPVKTANPQPKPHTADHLSEPSLEPRRLSVKDVVMSLPVTSDEEKSPSKKSGHHDRGRRPSQAALTQREDVLKFEQGRIKALQEERLHIQKKTFTKWVNSFLQKARMELDDLFTDLADGRKLLKLLEIISGEKLGKPNNGKMRVHKVENLNKSLAFLQTKKVRLESIGAEDIVDGNPRLILGLIWTIILRFQIQEIEIDVDEDNESSEKKSAKDALLLWCQRKTNGYQGVHITDFTGSWRSGLGFNALIHAHRPHLVDYDNLVPSRHIDNLNNAFDVAHTELGIPRLLDAEDVDSARPDEKSVLTYVASYYHTFARMKNEQKSGRRIANIVGQMMDADRKKDQYDRLTSALLEWIRVKVIDLEDRQFPNSLEGIQKELLRFKQYRTIEKPPKYKERSEIEALYFHVNTLLKSLNQPGFQPSDGHLIQDLQRAWETLEKAEHRREVALRQELLRQEKLEQLNYKFARKSVLREGYVKEMIQVLSDPRYGNNMSHVDATVKKHEAISADILARRERFNDLSAMSLELRQENYHGAEKVAAREAEILRKWEELLEILERHKMSLNVQSSLMGALREIDTLTATIRDLHAQFQSEGVGEHLLAVEDLLQKHALQELQVTAVGETLSRLRRHGSQFVAAKHRDAPVLQERLDLCDRAYETLVRSSEERRARLEDARNLYQFIQDHEEEEAWLVERQRICTAAIAAKDLRAVLSLQQKHKALMDEIKARRLKSEQLREAGLRLVAEKHPRAAEIRPRIESLQSHWAQLQQLSETRKKQLEDAAEAYQFYTDANEAESWLKEKMALVTSTDYGVDAPSAQALLARHRDLRGEIQAYKGDITSLNAHASKLMQSGVASLELSADPEPEVEEWRTETRLVPQEVWEDEPYERVENQITYEMRLVPQVKSLYPFNGQGMSMAKGEVMVILSKTNGDWWNVRKDNGVEGFVPANYVREIDPKPMSVQVQRPEKIKDVRKVKKTKMVRQNVKVKKPVTPKRTSVSDDNNLNVERRQKNINETYGELLKLADRRHQFLEDAIHLYGFYAECDDFEKWINDKERFLKTDDTSESPEHVDSAKRKYENFLTDLSASSKRIEALDHAVADFQAQRHTQIDKILARQKQIHALLKHLNWLKAQKEKSLEGASSVQVFHRTCDEARDWMSEKLGQLEGADHGPDLKTVQALQRRHQALERELAPVEEKVNRVNLLAESVKASYPHEKPRVDVRQAEVQKLWEKVRGQATEKRARLEDAVGMQIFMNSSQSLLNWADDVVETLNTDVAVRDVATAENLQKNHSELQDDIRAHEDEWDELVTLGRTLQARNQNNPVLRDRLAALIQAHDAVTHGWLARENWLKQCLDLQLFNREADQLDASTSAHEAVLDVTDLGRSLDEVKALEKRHQDLEKTLAAQDERLMAFNDVADKLVSKKHYDADNIDGRRSQVLARRQAVKDLAEQRRAALMGANNFQEFTAKVEDLRSWVTEKTKIASDESYRDLNNLERKLQKHEAFERELKANEGQLRAVNKKGASAGAGDPQRVADVAAMLAALNSEWDNMTALTRDKGRRLRQAAAQREYNRTLEAARVKLEEVKQALSSTQVGDDLRHCKDLLKKHTALEQDIASWKNKIADVVAEGQAMAQEGHFDADSILKVGKDCQKKFLALDTPARLRRDMLEESLRFYNFGFELNSELTWVREHRPLAESTAVGSNLHQAQAFDKKHKKLQAEIDGHQSMINKTLDSGKLLLEQNHPRKTEIQTQSQSLQTEWSELKQAASDRARKLELSLKAQEFFFEAEEVESWLAEKNEGLQSTDYGRDRDAASKLLAKHKDLELELDSYNGIVTEMGHVAEKMVSTGHPDAKAITARQQVLQQQMKQLQKLAAARQVRLMESMYRHEYLLASAELDQWIKEQMLTATSEEYGQDFEHLQVIRSKFDDWKLRMEAESERFAQCKELADKLIMADSPYVEDVEKNQEQLGAAWQKLLEQIRNREQRLTAAGEIHRFHRDVADALSRIQEKDAALPEDLGRDLNSVLALIKRHEGFENDLVALEAQLQVLVEDGTRLQSQFPGLNAVQIGAQQKTVVEQWAGLQARSTDRRDLLNKACDLHKFLRQARDLINWSSGLRTAMKAQEKVRDAGSAQTLKTEHEAIKAEIEAREDNFEKAVTLCKQMIQDQHYASDEVNEKLGQLLEERQNLHSAWQHKKVQLDQLIDLHFFMREAKQILTLSSTQEAALNTPDTDGSVDEVASQAKKHDAFEKLVATQEDRVAALQEHGAKLVAQNHFDSPSIEEHLKEVVTRRKRVQELCRLRRQKLQESLLYAQFVRDVAEAEAWVAERQKRLQSDASTGEEVASLEYKIAKLQKHQAFQAELAAHEPRIAGIKGQLDRLVAQRHAATPSAQQAWTRLSSAWRQLLANADSHGQGLEEAQDILEFHNQVDKIEAWIRDKEMLVQAGETGEDLEHCLQLQRKLDDVDSDMRVDDARIKSINALADKLIRQGRSDTQEVQQKRDRLLSRWQGLEGALQAYREKLAGALEVHGLTRDVDDTRSRIHEKAVTMSSQDLGRDLPAVQQLQRRQEAVQRDMTAIDGKIKEHDGTSRVLMKRHPEMSEGISTRVASLQKDWKDLLALSEERRAALRDAHQKHKLAADMQELREWVNTTVKRMRDMELPASANDAEAAIKLHAERKAEIDGRSDAFEAIRTAGTPETAKELQELKTQLETAWADQKESLNQAKQLAMFKDQADEAARWLSSKEAFLNNDDLGDSLPAVEVLLQKLEAFEKTLAAQAARVDELEHAAAQLDNAPGVAPRIQQIKMRWSRLQDSSAQRRAKLVDTRQLLCFLRNIYEVQGWLHSKILIANDESYRDPSNLQSKIQKHSAFEAELQANQSRVEAVVAEGDKLKGQEHFASDEISEQVTIVSKLWTDVSASSLKKRQKLADAYEALLFLRSVEELEGWMDEMETVLSSEDHGSDLASVAHLLRRHKATEDAMLTRNEDMESLKVQVTAFEKADHFMKDELVERFTAAYKRYNSLQKPMEIRRENLEESLLLQQFTRDVEEELQWLEDAEPALSSKDLGTSLINVQSLQKKHQALETELTARKPVIDALGVRAAQMIRANHFASEDVDAKMKDLRTHFERNVDLASVRRLRLLDAVESQTFYAEASYASSWMREKKPGLSSSHAGKDEDSVAGLMKRLEAAQRDLQTFGATVHRLKKLAQGLVDRGHFDHANIQAKQTELETSYEELLQLAATRQQRLTDSLELFRFMREAGEVSEWIQDQMTVAASEDYGSDVEHVEQLIKKFDAFIASLNAAEVRVQANVAKGQGLMAANHPESDRIKEKLRETKASWVDIKELAHARQEALSGAKQVHIFDRSADETIEWVEEKAAALRSEGFSQDLETIQASVRKHEAFESELGAVRSQVDAVKSEAKRLAQAFPDTQEHVEVKCDEVTEVWRSLLDASAQHRERLLQSEQLQSYFDQHRDLMAWLNEMLAKITAPELARDVAGAEALITQHVEHRVELDARKDELHKFFTDGAKLVKQGHFLAEDVEEKINALRLRNKLVTGTWDARKDLYYQNLDTQMFKRHADLLESWLVSREPILRDPALGESIPQAEDLLRKHDDFLTTISAQEDAFEELKRITLLEQSFQKQKEAEKAAKSAERDRLEKEKIEARKRKEVQRITDERRREEERRRLQDGRGHGKEGMNGNASPEASRLHPPESPSLQKSGSLTQLIGDRMRREMKRAESMKVDLKKPKRTPSFTTRRRTQSFRKHQKIDNADLPPVEVGGYLERKQELQSGGKKAPVRSWKTFYTVLCGQLLCFFKDQEDFVNSKAASSPVSILKASVAHAQDYTKRKYVFRLVCTDGSEYLFLANTEEEMNDWVNKIAFHAQLPPSLQLLSYDDTQKRALEDRLAASSESSRASSPEPNSPRSNQLSPAPPVQTQTQFLAQHRPPIPPRSAPPPIPTRRTNTVESVDVRDGPVRENGNVDVGTPANNWRHSVDSPSVGMSPPPPLPVSLPPRGYIMSPPHGSLPPQYYQHASLPREWSNNHEPNHYFNQSYGNLPAPLPRPPSVASGSSAELGRRASESSSESELPRNAKEKDTKEGKDKRSVFNLFQRKKKGAQV